MEALLHLCIGVVLGSAGLWVYVEGEVTVQVKERRSSIQDQPVLPQVQNKGARGCLEKR